MRNHLVKVREIGGLTFGGVATLAVLVVAVVVIALGKLLVNAVKLVCLPLILLASFLFPDDRPLRRRIVSDVVDWWKLTHPAF